MPRETPHPLYIAAHTSHVGPTGQSLDTLALELLKMIDTRFRGIVSLNTLKEEQPLATAWIA